MKTFILGLFVLQLCACAQPDYLPTDDDLAQQNQEQDSVKCNLSFQEAEICAQLTWKVKPNSHSATDFELIFNSEKVQLENLSIVLWMPSMGHGSAPVKIDEIAPGQFYVYNVYFIMPGDWEVRIYLKENTNTLDQVYVPLMVP